MSEKIENAAEQPDELVEKIKRLLRDHFDEVYERSAVFVAKLKEDVAKEFPDDERPWEMVPAYHALAGSSMKNDHMREVSAESKLKVSETIAVFIKEIEQELNG